MNQLLSEVIANPYGVDTSCIKLVIDDITQPFQFNDIKDTGHNYSFSTWIKGDTSLSVMLNNEQFYFGTDWIKIESTFMADAEVMELYFCDVGTYYMYHPKLEAGHKVTDWSPAPDDVSESIDKAQNTADSKPNTFIGTYILTDTEDIIYYQTDENGNTVYVCKVDDIYYQVTESEGVYTKTDTVVEVDATALHSLETTPPAPYKIGDIWTTAGGYTKTCIAPSEFIFDESDWTESMEQIVLEFREAQATIEKLIDRINMIVVGTVYFEVVYSEEQGGYIKTDKQLTKMDGILLNGQFTLTGEQIYGYTNENDEDIRYCIVDCGTLWEQTATGWTFRFDNVTNNIQPSVDNFDKISPYIRNHVVNGQACIEIGDYNDPFKVQITKDEMRFMQYNNRIAYMSNESMYIKNAVIDDGLDIGNFEIKERANGNVGIAWKGE